jgi:hypothetical protein
MQSFPFNSPVFYQAQKDCKRLLAIIGVQDYILCSQLINGNECCEKFLDKEGFFFFAYYHYIETRSRFTLIISKQIKFE